MAVYKETILLKSHGKTPTYVNITPQVREAIEKSGIQNGICTVISPHTTCSVFFEEFVHDYNEAGDEFLQEDLNDVLKKIIPDHVSADQYNYPGEEHYKAVESWARCQIHIFQTEIEQLYLWCGPLNINTDRFQCNIRS